LRIPFTERLVELQMLALYRCGRQADALAAFQATRGRFVDELGIEPARPLRELHDDVLQHAAELAPPEWTLEARPRPATPSALGNRRLPVPANRTIGRGHELAAVGERLRAGSVRLLTLTGPGGVGKTRLALEVARSVHADFADGAHFVSLAAVQRPDDVPAALVNALGIIVLAGESADQAAQRFLAAKHALLVVDNLEHLLAAAPFIGGLLGACPEVTILATSREPLALRAEERYRVSPLALPEPTAPDDPEALAGVDAVALFCERARAHDPDLRLGDANAAAVAEICQRLDGLPLAIELAAARCALLSPGEIAERLHEALGALGAGARDAPARQQTLRATIDWSHDLLDEAEKACFAKFAVFAGGATVDAAETITAARLDTLDHLVAKSMVARRQSVGTPTRLMMLETIRAYATEQLAASADHDPIRGRHYRFYLALAQRHGTEQALSGVDSKRHVAVLDADTDNLDAGLAWAMDRPDAEPALAMVAALGRFWLMRYRYGDAVKWIDQALSMGGADAHPVLRFRALRYRIWCLRPLGRAREQAAALADAEAIARDLKDPVILSQALRNRAHLEAFAGHHSAADALANEALSWANTAGDAWEVALAFNVKAEAASTIADVRRRVDLAASLLEKVGNRYDLAGLLVNASYAALCAARDRDAMELVDRAGPIARELDSPYVWMLLRGNLGLAALLTGDTETARHAFREELTLCRELVVLPTAFEGLRGLAAVAIIDGNANRAATLLGAATAHRYGEPSAALDARLETAFFKAARTR
jgi:predicted ATPase